MWLFTFTSLIRSFVVTNWLFYHAIRSCFFLFIISIFFKFSSREQADRTNLTLNSVNGEKKKKSKTGWKKINKTRWKIELIKSFKSVYFEVFFWNLHHSYTYRDFIYLFIYHLLPARQPISDVRILHSASGNLFWSQYSLCVWLFSFFSILYLFILCLFFLLILRNIFFSAICWKW